MRLESMRYQPLDKISFTRIVPSTNESGFRNQILRRYVQDQGATIMGVGVGHADLFVDTYDIASIMQILHNGGVMNESRIFKKETVNLFTSYQS